MNEDKKQKWKDIVKSKNRNFQGGNYRAFRRDLQNTDINEFPKKEHMNTGYGSFSISIVMRFLRSKVGQKWDDVYSEINSRLTGKDYNKERVLDIIGKGSSRLWGSVIFNLKKIDGKLFFWNGDPFPGERQYGNILYVDPDTKTLEVVNNPRKKKKKAKPVNSFVLDRLTQYHKIAGIWYKVKFAELGPEENNQRDIVRESKIQAKEFDQRTLSYYAGIAPNMIVYSRNHFKDTYGEFIKPISKKQCGKKDLKEIKEKLG